MASTLLPSGWVSIDIKAIGETIPGADSWSGSITKLSQDDGILIMVVNLD